MRILIDGYNLAHQITLPAGKVSPDVLDRSRDELLRMLASAFADSIDQLTVVFDTRRVRRVEPEMTIHGIDVRFAVGEQADDLIERLIKAHTSPRQLTVVSDDHRLQAAARRRDCRVVGCQPFLDSLEHGRGPKPQLAPDEKPQMPDAEVTAAWERAFAEDRRSQRLPRRHGPRN